MLTNRQVVQRLYNFTGEIRTASPTTKSNPMKLRKEALITILKEEGMDTPAQCKFMVRKGIGYIIPLRAAA